MDLPDEKNQETVKETGAPGGSILVGVKNHNRGLRIKIFLDQQGRGGRIVGKFRVLNEGSGYHASAFEPFVGKEFDSADEMVHVAQTLIPDATHFLNGNSLKVEK